MVRPYLQNTNTLCPLNNVSPESLGSSLEHALLHSRQSTIETVHSFHWNGLHIIHIIKTRGLTMDVVLWICSLIIHFYILYLISY